MRRRDFIQKSAASTATTALSARRILGANDRVVVGLIGCGGRGQEVARLMANVPGAEYGACCDVYLPNADATRQLLNPQAKVLGDFRKLLELKEVDAVHVATPDHWHAIAMVMACQAGKDVYVEKPLAHNIHEGKAMVAAAKKHNRIVQTGMQHRSAPHYREVERIIQSGEIGEVRFVRVWNFTNLTPFGIGPSQKTSVPEGLDWDFYLGPAPSRPFDKRRFLRTYRWFWDYAGGTITDFGTHRFDTVHQVMGADTPRTISATGGRFSLKDGGEMPDVLQATYEYPGFVMSYEACNLNGMGTGVRTPGMAYYSMRRDIDRPHGEAYYGTNGTLLSDRIGYEVFPEPKAIPKKDGSLDIKAPIEAYRSQARRVQSKDATDLHVRNFIECVRSRQTPVADITIGHRSTAVAHLGNIAFKTGRKLVWDGTKEDFAGDAEASKLLRREARKPWDLI